MEMKQVSDNCFAVLIEKNRVCDANSGLINLAGGVVIDTQSDLPHARQMIEMFSKVWPAMPQRVINTHEGADHVRSSQLFEGAESISHRSGPTGNPFSVLQTRVPILSPGSRRWPSCPSGDRSGNHRACHTRRSAEPAGQDRRLRLEDAGVHGRVAEAVENRDQNYLEFNAATRQPMP